MFGAQSLIVAVRGCVRRPPAQVVRHGCDAVAELLAAGLLPVLHGDAVLDTALGCTILSG